MKKKTLFIIAGIVVIVALVVGFTLLNNSSNGKLQYRTEKVDRGDIEAVVMATGQLNPVVLVEVGSQVSGKIEKIYVDFNSRVKEGDILAELDQSQLKAQIEQNEANYRSAMASVERSKVSLEIAQKNFERAKSLFEKKLISQEEMDQAESAYLQAKADLVSAEARAAQAEYQLDASKVNLSYAIIRSPIDGIVISRDVNVGQTVAASFQAPVLFKIANDLTKMQVECLVDEADVGRVKEGQKVKFTVEAFPNETFWGQVRQVRYAALVTSNVVQYTAVLDVDNSSLKLLPGMTATCSIIVEEAKNVLRVPNAALRFTPNLKPEELQKIMQSAFEEMSARRQQQGREGSSPSVRTAQAQPGEMAMLGSRGQSGQRRAPTRVWMVDENGKLKVVFVRTGVTDNTYTEILGDSLKEGDEVIVGILTASSNVSSSSSGRPGPPGAIRIGR
ncbi:MAG: efflux RND transporter periplasmic adaptor subunit [Acidobacteriota bacterium]|nr:efflux RND transporter periplasmic adaptor subunit [Acidobacteriota bacterium]MDW3228428.1 efflux RND transporter periplasmic adaptor subunit [Acidobacteriota bacterium]MDY0231306.1 efflux RND transporter periplasmic adaptor subunit [Candidatus Saccharicenans sp.]